MARTHIEQLEPRALLAGDRTFIEMPLWETFGHADKITVVGDFDNDGFDDFVVHAAKRDPSLDNAWYRLNRETNRLEFAGLIPSRDSGTVISPLAAADIDSDGDLDLVMEVTLIAIDAHPRFEWLENTDGRGTFSGLHTIVYRPGTVAYIRLSDLDDDGDVDASYYGGYSTGSYENGWAENRGGVFTYRLIMDNVVDDDRHLYDPDGDGVRRVAKAVSAVDGVYTVDLDGDTDLDLISSLRNSGAAWWENQDGQAHFVPREFSGFSSQKLRIRPDDVDQDGDIDLWFQSSTTLQWMENNGRGEFTARSFPTSLVGTLSLADVDGDGRSELVGLDPATNEFVWYDYDPATEAVAVHPGGAPGREVSQSIVDMNRDGVSDIVGLFGWYEQTATRDGFVPRRYPKELRPDVVVPADVDRDGAIDLISLTNSGSVVRPVVTLRWSRVTNEGVVATHGIDEVVRDRNHFFSEHPELRGEDLDNDGDLDLLVLVNATVRWWENTDGLAQFVSRGRFANVPNVTSLRRFADLDGDHDWDILWEYNSVLYWQERTATGAYRPHPIMNAFNRGDLGPTAVADLDGDGDLDVISSRGKIVAWHENLDGRGSFVSEGREIGRVETISVVATGDFNADGDLDVIVGDLRNRETFFHDLPPDPDIDYHVYDNQNGRGDFVPTEPVIRRRGELVLAADVDGDGLADLVESPRSIPGIIIHRNTTPVVRPLGDVNQDGVADMFDIDELCKAIGKMLNQPRFDMNGDSRTDLEDHRYLVEEVLRILPGDANADGDFDASDLVRAFSQGAYENAVGTSRWEGGDWNCDGRFTSSDLVQAFQTSRYEAESRDAFVLVASQLTNQILRFNGVTGRYVGEFARTNGPFDMVVGPDGDLFVSGPGSPTTINRFRPDGTLRASVSLTATLDVPTLALAQNGDLLALLFYGRRIERFSTAGGGLKSRGQFVGLGDVIPDTLTIGPDGDIYVGIRSPAEIWRYDGETGVLRGVFAALGTIGAGAVDDPPRSPQGMAFGPNGDLYVGVDNWTNGEIRRFHGTTGEMVDIFVRDIPYDYGSLEPVFTDDGYLLVAVANFEDNIYRYDAKTGSLIDVLIGDDRGGMQNASSIVYLPAEG
jgi:hypothetical protein